MGWITALKMAWTYRNEIAIGIIILALVSLGFYFKHVLNDRDALKSDIAKLQVEMNQAKQQMTLNEDIANAIKKIKVAIS